MKKFHVLVKIEMAGCGFKWVAVHSTNGSAYEFTKENAEKYLETYSKGRGDLKIQEI